MERTILVLGAGFIARPCIQYLLRNPENRVTVADLSMERVERVLEGHSRGAALVGEVDSSLDKWIDELQPDLVVALLPKPFFFKVAWLCADRKIDFILPTTPTPEVIAIKEEIEASGVCAIAELGVDPGIDHMIAMRTIEGIRGIEGSVDSFWSACGSLPALESNTNPLGYKMSWAPDHVVYAGSRDALFLKNAETVLFPGGETFENYELIEAGDEGWFECYADGNALVYADIYGIQETRNLFRGTFRYPGWCEFYTALRKLGFFSNQKLITPEMSYAGLLRKIANLDKEKPVAASVAEFLGVPVHAAVLSRLQWLGLFDEHPVPRDIQEPANLLCRLLVEKLTYRPGEKDIVVMLQSIEFHDPRGHRFLKTSKLVDKGIVGQETAIARTTGLPIAMGSELLLDGVFREPGLHIPVIPEIYEPILKMLEDEDIRIEERTTGI